MSDQAGPAIASLVGGLVAGWGYKEPDRFELTLQPGRLGSKKAVDEEIVISFLGVLNRDRVQRFCFGRRRWKPVGEFMDQLTSVEHRSYGWVLQFLRAGRLLVRAGEATSAVKE